MKKKPFVLQYIATGNFFFVLLLALASVNFDVYSIDFVMLLLNGVPFSIFVLKNLLFVFEKKFLITYNFEKF